AVTQLDQATQQNAALVEQSAAAAESMRFQAEQLVQAVGVFQTSGSGASSHASATASATASASRAAPRSVEHRAVAPARKASPARRTIAAPMGAPAFAHAGAGAIAPSRPGTDDWESF
ncbi:hypothetical protein ABID77_004134, partial [Variovorax sp. PvP013]